MRIVIAGGPRTGKTTYSKLLPGPVFHTDNLMIVGNVEQQENAAQNWLEKPDPWVIEGATVIRAVRLWLRRNAAGRPCDRLIWLDTPRVTCTKWQTVQAKGCLTVFRQIEGELERRGVEILVNPPPPGNGP